MKQPRRIFRSSLSARTGWAARPAAWLAALLGAAALVAIGVSAGLPERHAPAPRRLLADAAQVAVIGGDTLRLGGTVVRLAGVEAPDRGDTCKGGTDCGGAAAAALAGLIQDRQVECRLSGHDHMGRPYAACDANGLDLSSAIVASGWARAQHDRPLLADLELRARRRGAGLWASAAP